MPPRRRKLENVIRWDFLPPAGRDGGAPAHGPARADIRASTYPSPGTTSAPSSRGLRTPSRPS
eukprot:9311158-Alexandrium_andersonii.AAC.1